MKPLKLILCCIILAAALSPLFPAVCRAASQEELLEKINLLEIQIQQLKEMKAQQNKTQEKEQQCILAVGTEKFCTCLAEALPGDVSFEQYVHDMVSLAELSRDDSRKGGAKGDVDAVHAARNKCVQKGLFW
ncbi:MAG: hypothetical protein HXX11_09380 [Desulfuromonadales bacterium]|nr:hypothetical protein [Desulfuromonadales bacterium]